MLRSPALIITMLFTLLVAGLLFVAKYQRAPLPGKLLPKAPQTIQVDANKLGTILQNAPWVSPGLSGPVLYTIGYRACPNCIAYERTEFDDLHRAGVDTRAIVFARRKVSTPNERAVAAELACTRDWSIYEHWMEDVEEAYYENYGVPPAPKGDKRRSACLEWGRMVYDRIDVIMQKNGRSMETPGLFWKNKKGDWRVFLGDDARGKRAIRRELGVPIR